MTSHLCERHRETKNALLAEAEDTEKQKEHFLPKLTTSERHLSSAKDIAEKREDTVNSSSPQSRLKWHAKVGNVGHHRKSYVDVRIPLAGELVARRLVRLERRTRVEPYPALFEGGARVDFLTLGHDLRRHLPPSPTEK